MTGNSVCCLYARAWARESGASHTTVVQRRFAADTVIAVIIQTTVVVCDASSSTTGERTLRSGHTGHELVRQPRFHWQGDPSDTV